MNNYIELDFEVLRKLDFKRLDNIILEFQHILNTSDNYDYQWSILEVIDNLNDGYFDIVLEDRELVIFGIMVTDLTDNEIRHLEIKTI